MSLIGNSVLSAVFVGSTSYSAIYVGTQCVFQNKVDVTINLNYGLGNSGTSSIKGELNKSLTSIGKSLPTKATSGNTIDVITWHTSSTFSESNVFNNSTIITKNMISNNAITLYAEYSSSVIFHLNYDDLTYQIIKLNSDKTVTIPSAPTRDKYTFGGWYLNSACTGSAITSSTTFTQSTTVYAKWTKKQYTLAWNFDGGTASGSYTTAGTYNVDTTIVYPIVTKTNYTFNYWSPNPTKLTENTTIRAYWTQSNIPVTGISLSKSNTSVTVGSTVTLIATVTPSNATNKTITWSTSNSSVATVSNGTVTGKSSGTVTITATSNNGKSASCSITVQAVGTNGWVGSANAGSISISKTSFAASLDNANVSNSASADINTLRYRVYNSDGLTYTDYTPTISYSWVVSGDGLSVDQSNTVSTSVTYASRGATVGAARSGSIKRKAIFTYGSYSTSLDSNTITVTQAANSSTKVIDNIEYGKPSTPRTNNSTKGVRAWTATYTSSVTNKQHWHYTYTSGYVGGAETPTNIAGTVSWSISWQECPGGNRFSISTSGVVSHISMTTNAGIDQATVKATNAEDSSKSASASISTDTNVVTNSVKEEDISNNSGKGVTETEYKIDNISLSCTYSEITAAGGSQYPSTSYNYDLTTTSKTKYAVRYKYTYSTGSIGYTDWTTDGVNWQYGTPETRTLNQGGTITYSCSNQISATPKFILNSTSNGKVTADNLGTTSYPNGRSISISVELSINTGNATGSKTITTTASQHFNTSTSSSSSPSYTAKLLKSPTPYINSDVELNEKISANGTNIFFRLISSYSTYKLWTSGATSDTNSVSEMVDLAGITPIIPGGKPNWISFPSSNSVINKAITISIAANTGGERASRVYVNYNGRSYPDTEGISFTQKKYIAPQAPKFTINGVEYTASDSNPNYITHISNVYVFLVPVRISGDGNGNNVNNYCVVASGQPNKVLKITGGFFITEPGKTTPTSVNITGNPVITRNLTSVGFADQTFSGYGVSVMEGGIAGTLNTAKSIVVTEKQ